jgi:hypothetical protein
MRSTRTLGARAAAAGAPRDPGGRRPSGSRARVIDNGRADDVVDVHDGGAAAASALGDDVAHPSTAAAAGAVSPAQSVGSVDRCSTRRGRERDERRADQRSVDERRDHDDATRR